MEVVVARQQIRVLVVDDQAIVRKGLRAFLGQCENIDVIGEAANGRTALELVEKSKPDVILVDLLMPDMDGIETIKRILANHPDQRTILLTASFDDEKLLQAVKAGALGYVRKDARPEELTRAIENAFDGDPFINPAILVKLLKDAREGEKDDPRIFDLSEREKEVLVLIARGYGDQEIADKLVLTTVTVRSHVSRIRSKLGLNNRVQAALYALRSGMVELETNLIEGDDF
jgi:two-component system, NarL family, response regulator LiaR